MLLSVRELRKIFPVERGLFGRPVSTVAAVNGITLQVQGGETVGIVGESGCGKSTLGKCVTALSAPTSGSIHWEGKDVRGIPPEEMRRARRSYQMVFQNPFASLDPRQRVRAILEEPLRIHGLEPPEGKDRYLAGILERVGLTAGDLRKYPHEFSGGQRQRIALARALACRPRLMVLDEPVSSLDVSVQASVLNLLARLNREEGIAYLFISHDLQVVGHLCGRILVLYLGQVVEEGPVDRVLRRPRHPYTVGLLAASIGEAPDLKGEPPDPANPPSGCPFHPRCPVAEERCRVESQSLLQVGEGWRAACWKALS